MKPIAFVDLKAQYTRLKSEIDGGIARVLEHGTFIMGPEVAALETGLARFAGARHAVAVSSGTDALLMALMALDVGRGSAVFLPAFTFTATAEVVLVAGATPVFVDVDPVTYNLSPADLERKIASVQKAGTLRPAAVVPVDLFGLPADYPAIDAVAKKHTLTVIADAAQSYGARTPRGRVGTLAPMTAISFFPSKPLGCYGDGGAILTDDDKLAAVLRSIRVHGAGTDKYDIVRIGVNGRLDTIQAAVLLPKLGIFDDELRQRERVSSRYDALLKGKIVVPPRLPGTDSAWAQYTVQVSHRDKVAAAMKAKGVPTAVYYPRPMHHQPAYRAYADGPLPVSDELAQRVLSLPMHPYLDDASATLVCEALLEAVAATA